MGFHEKWFYVTFTSWSSLALGLLLVIGLLAVIHFLVVDFLVRLGS